MSAKKIAIAVAVVLYAVGGCFAAKYIAGGAYFLLNKTGREIITLDTWQTYWHWYGDDPVQRKRLQVAAVASGVIVYLIPLIAISAIGGQRRSLHGDARWATAAEIRKAGLL